MRPRYLDRLGIDWLAAIVCLTLVAAGHFGCSIPLPIVPTPDPINPPGPVIVVPVGGLRVLIVEETADRSMLPAEQRAVFTSAPFRKFIRDSKATLRVWDQQIDAENESDAGFKSMLQVPRAKLPWIVIVGKKTISQPLPGTVAETEALIQGAQ